MKSKILALAILAFTAVAVGIYPQLQGAASSTPVTATPPAADHLANTKPRVEGAFVLDTTGSMGGLIQAAKDKIWSIASTMAQAEPTPEIRIGLVAYRDRGDDYVTRVVDLTSDLDAVHAELFQFQAQGGGDGPEAVNEALHDALHSISWSPSSANGDQTYRAIFLVGDAPPHMDYQDDVKYPETLKLAKQRSVRVNAIQCGQDGKTLNTWQSIAQLGNGDYFQVDQTGSAVAVVTPYDEKLARLSDALDETRIHYGSEDERKAIAAKRDRVVGALAASSTSTKARRAAFVASEAGEKAFEADKDLVADATSGRVDIDAIEAEMLPAPMQAMSKEEQRARITQVAAEREKIKKEITKVARQRTEYMRKSLVETGKADDSLDTKLYRSVRSQAADVGLEYTDEAPAF